MLPAIGWTGSGRFDLGPNSVTGSPQREEARAAPGRAGDGTRDRREARVDRPLPIEAIAGHGDGMAPALVIANEHGAGFELPPVRTALARQPIQKSQAVAIEAAESLLLDLPGDHTRQQVFAQGRRRYASEHGPPAPPKGIAGKRSDASDLGMRLPAGALYDAGNRCSTRSVQQPQHLHLLRMRAREAMARTLAAGRL